MRHTLDGRRRVIATGAGVGTAVVIHVLTLLNWSTELDRTANPLGYASNFFDYQARAFLDGHLWVPDGVLGIEAFVEDGREYMYFGPFPALLRIPVLWTTSEFDGRLTVASMALAFAVLCVMASRLLWLIRDLARPTRPVGAFESWLLAITLAACLGGTTMTFNAALPWVYHEVYAWAVALAVAALYWLVRVHLDPRRWTIGWFATVLVALVLTRTPGGFALCLGAGATAVLLYRRSPTLRRAAVGLGAVMVVAVGVGVAVNAAKFGHPYMFPLENQVWTEVNAHRREALEVNGGSITGPQFFPSTFMAYFRLDGVRLVDYFPFVTFPAEPAPAYAGAFLDQAYRTGSVTAFMPLLLLLALAALPVAFRPSATWATSLRVPVICAVLITGAVMNYGYIAYRYTSEFVPALVLGTMITSVWLAGKLAQGRRLARWTAVALFSVGTAWSVAAHALVGFTTAAMTAPGPDLARYLGIQHAITPHAQARLVTTSPAPPSERAAPDRIHIEGDCDALYVESGDQSDAWLLAERRSTVVVASMTEDFRAGSAIVTTIETEPRRWVRLQTDDSGRARVVLEHENGRYPGPWFDVRPPYEVRIGIRDLPGWGYAEISSTPGGFVGYLQSFSWGSEWHREPIAITPVDGQPLRRRGITLTSEPGITPVVCPELLVASAGSHG